MESRWRLEQDRFLAEVSRLRGWEPNWQTMAATLATVRLDESYRSSTAGQGVFQRATTWWKDGGREYGTTRYAGNGRSDWRITGGVYAQRWDAGPWKAISRGPAGFPEGIPTGAEILDAWGAESGQIRHDPGGHLVFHLIRRGRVGAVELDADEAGRLVTAIRMYGPVGHLEWHESRTYARTAGRSLLATRERRYLEPAGLIEEEHCAWTLGSAAGAEAVLASADVP